MLEGVRLVGEALAAGTRVRGAVVSEVLEATPRGAALRRAAAERGIPIEAVDHRTLMSLADTETPQGIVAIIEIPRRSPDSVTLPDRAVVLALDGIQDPGNAGALVRTAHALGAAATLALSGTADVYGAKALRAAMGATLHHPVVGLATTAFPSWLQRHRLTLWLAEAGGTPLADLSRPDRVAVVVGSEAAGVSPAIRALPHTTVGIPLAQGAESLNVAVAAGILLYEVVAR